MTRTTSAPHLFLLPLLLFVGNAFADGFNPMELKQVLYQTDTILVVQIIQNQETITHKNKGKGFGKESVRYDYDIKSKVLESPVAEFTEAEYNTRYSLVLAKGVWVAIPGSGLEGNMKPGEEYVFLLKKTDKTYRLLRAEKSDALKTILKLRKAQQEEDKRIAEEQQKIPNGIYHYSRNTDGQRIRLQDGSRIRLGDKYSPDIVRRELHSLFDSTTLIELSLTLGSGTAKPCILMIGGNAYWLYDHSGNAVFMGYAPGAKKPPALYCSINSKKDAEALASFFKISIFHRQSKSKNVNKKK